MRSVALLAALVPGCCGLGNLGGFHSSSGSRRAPDPADDDPDEAAAAEPETTGADDADAERSAALPDDAVGLGIAFDAGADLHIDTTFAECTDPTGAAVGGFAGVGVRWNGKGVIARVGGNIGAVGGHDASETHGRGGLWAGFGYSGVLVSGRGGAGTWSITPLVTRTTYLDGGAGDASARSMTGSTPSDTRWGGGLAIDAFSRRGNRPAFHLGFRMVGDAREVVGTMVIGVALTR